MTNRMRWIGLVLWVALCLAVGGIGSLATTPEIGGWYRTLEKPAWNPPDWVFGPVWTTLYVLMGIAAWIISQPGGFRNARLMLFLVQLALNLLWSFVFFAWHEPGWAFAEIVLLWLLILATMIAFFRRHKLAGWLLVPYLLWVSYASTLNFMLWRLNS